ESAVLSVDGNGGDVSALMGIWNSDGFKMIKAINSPQSIGVQYGMITEFLGFRSGYDEYKVMGMAAYGDPSRFIKAFDKILAYENGKLSSLNAGLIFKLNYCLQALEKILGIKKRTPFAEIKTEHFDLAAALQKATEKILFSIVNELKEKSGSNNLCLSGGVFMNSVANGLIKKQAVFDNIYIPPVPADNGTALGAAFWLWHSLGKAKIQQPQTVYFGPHFSDQQIENCLQNEQNELAFYKSENIVNEAVEILADNKVIGWFQGRMELGARALGNRSILANCAYAEMKDRINILIKNRENFRPFAGSVPLENVNDFFEFENESPYMQMVVNIKEDKRDLIKAIDHFGTCRIQTVKKEENPLFHQLLTAFGGRTGLPVLLNTSFNVNDSPIVCSPADAIHAFKRMNLDALVIGNYIVKKLSFSI
ncbi:MAG: carbamoyltransferase family protein, partial [Bacteroidia bacterium]